MPFYDRDTKLVFLVGKGTNKLFLAEFQSKMPFLSPVYEMSLTEQNLGACLGNKRNVNVMSGEVDIFYQLTKHSILPVPCIVPRRSYRDFHADLFPDTRGTSAGCSSTEWLEGSNALVNRSIPTFCMVDHIIGFHDIKIELQPPLVSLAPNAAPVLTSPVQSTDQMLSTSSTAVSSPPLPEITPITTKSAQLQISPVLTKQPAELAESHVSLSPIHTSRTINEEVRYDLPARETNNLKEDVKELVYSVGDVAEKENEISDTTKEITYHTTV
ncbi:unnamed protein product [Strongylus vulgaris]|uniref:Uncharacterized protein n=1 Tax=Strongylus vulgaris TaxID=40348 RepID=A0A3P7JLC8_STRVU|nr:unnamed protein product [Strongylus vulgaris]